MSDKGWKKAFLSSSLPLEFAAGKVLASSKFTVTPDYCYERVDAGQTKDFSVDINGALLFPTSNPKEIYAELEVLVECKYRTPNTTWVFLPDVNRVDVSLGTFGDTIRCIDEFSFCRIPRDSIYEFESKMPSCYKGVEINLTAGNAYDSEIRHGISQLQYALPRLLSEQIRYQIGSHRLDVNPFFILPILVTTAELRVVDKNVSLKGVEDAEDLHAVSRKVPSLTLFSSFGPDFVSHARRYFEELADIGDAANIALIEKQLRASKLQFYESTLPSSIGKELSEGGHYRLQKYCSQFIVCTFEALSQTLDNVINAIRSCLRNRKSFYTEVAG